MKYGVLIYNEKCVGGVVCFVLYIVILNACIGFGVFFCIYEDILNIFFDIV